MVEIVYAKTRADLRAFFKIGTGYLPEEERYLSRYALPEINPLCANGESAYLMAKRDGKCVYRMFTGIDRTYEKATGKKQGYFSLFEGEEDEEAACLLLKELTRLQKRWGAESVIGPVSPDGSGFFMGAGEGDFSKQRGVLTGCGNAFSAGILRLNGFSPLAREMAFHIRMPAENPFDALSQRASERFGYRVCKMSDLPFGNLWKRRILSVSSELPAGEMLRILEKSRAYISAEHSYFLMRGDVCDAYLLSFRSKNTILRTGTLMTTKGVFTPPCALILTNAFLTNARRAHVTEYEASVIDETNLPSLGVVSRVNGEKTRLYTQFIKNI